MLNATSKITGFLFKTVTIAVSFTITCSYTQKQQFDGLLLLNFDFMMNDRQIYSISFQFPIFCYFFPGIKSLCNVKIHREVF